MKFTSFWPTSANPEKQNIPLMSKQLMAREVMELSQQLMMVPSITPDDGGCQSILMNRLSELGFTFYDLSNRGVTNTLALKNNSSGPRLLFAGHTDVVPPGPEDNWQFDPFSAHSDGEYLWGRGAADMKTGLAAMVVATEQYCRDFPNSNANIGFAITSDEEGEAIYGSQCIEAHLKEQKIPVDWCLVGEPTSNIELGDSLRIGRRGSLTGRLTVHGKQGHAAYPHLALNPIHQVSALIKKLANKRWDLPSRYYPSTSLQIVKVNCQSGAENVIPGTLEMTFNFRYSPKQTVEKLQGYVEKKLSKLGVKFDIEWSHDAFPYFSRRSPLLKALKTEIESETGHSPEISGAGGTSDGRFFARLGAHVVEFGVRNKTIHQINERVEIDDLKTLTWIYYKTLCRLFNN